MPLLKYFKHLFSVVDLREVSLPMSKPVWLLGLTGLVKTSYFMGHILLIRFMLSEILEKCLKEKIY